MSDFIKQEKLAAITKSSSLRPQAFSMNQQVPYAFPWKTAMHGNEVMLFNGVSINNPAETFTTAAAPSSPMPSTSSFNPFSTRHTRVKRKSESDETFV